MANIGVRSPYFVYREQAGGVSAKVEVTIDGTLEYTIIKNTGTSVRVDISDLVRDFLTPTYEGTLSVAIIASVPVSVSVKFYDTINATGLQVGTTYTETHTAYDGYGYFYEEYNFDFDNRVLLSESTIWAPESTAGSFFQIASGVINIVNYAADAEAGGSVTIKRQQCSKYDPVKVVFINKFGIPQDLYFFSKRVESVSSLSDSYKSANISTNGSYSKYAHQVVEFNRNGKKSYSLNTDYVDETYNTYMQELMLSEQVWLDISGATPQVIPVRVVSSDVSYKTSLNDKLVNYTVQFEEANDLINSVR
jgi:hypothetical protein